MAEFMLLMRNEGIPMANISEAERGAVMQEWGAWMGGLKEQGKLKGGLPFDPASAAVISSDGNTSQGYYSEGNDVNVGGYIHLECSDLNEAIEIAKSSPALHGAGSTVEVREFMSMEM